MKHPHLKVQFRRQGRPDIRRVITGCIEAERTPQLREASPTSRTSSHGTGWNRPTFPSIVAIRPTGRSRNCTDCWLSQGWIRETKVYGQWWHSEKGGEYLSNSIRCRPWCMVCLPLDAMILGQEPHELRHLFPPKLSRIPPVQWNNIWSSQFLLWALIFANGWKQISNCLS